MSKYGGLPPVQFRTRQFRSEISSVNVYPASIARTSVRIAAPHCLVGVGVASPSGGDSSLYPICPLPGGARCTKPQGGLGEAQVRRSVVGCSCRLSNSHSSQLNKLLVFRYSARQSTGTLTTWELRITLTTCDLRYEPWIIKRAS